MLIKKFVCFLILFVLVSASLSYKTQTVKAEDVDISIEKVIGLSNKPGVFRMASQDGSGFQPMYHQGLAVGSDGSIFIGDSSESQVEIFDKDFKSTGNFGSIGSEAGKFQHLTSLTIDSEDNLYCVDSFMGNIQIFQKDGTLIKKIGTKGTNPENLNTPTDIAFLKSGDYLITDFVNGVKIFSKDGTYKKEFTDDKNIKIGVENVGANRVEIDSEGYVYISVIGLGQSSISSNIFKYDQDGNFIITALASGTSDGMLGGIMTGLSVEGKTMALTTLNGQKTAVQRFEILPDAKKAVKFIDTVAVAPTTIQNIEKTNILRPTAVFLKNSKVYYLDGDLNRVVVLSDKKEFLGTILSPVYLYGYYHTNRKSPDGYLSNPQGVRVDSEGRIFVGNSNYHCVTVFDADGKQTARFGKAISSRGVVPGDFMNPTDVIINEEGYVFVSDVDETQNSVQVFDPDFEPVYAIEESFGRPQGLALNSEGSLIVVNSANSTLSIIDISSVADETTSEINVLPLEGVWPVGVATDPDDNMYVAMTGSEQIQIINPDGESIKTIGESGPEKGQFLSPQGVCVDGEGSIYTAETTNGRIQKFDPEGELLWSADLNWPGFTFITMDTQGKLYVTDCLHSTVLVINDPSAVPPEGTKPAQTNAAFSLQVKNTTVTEDDSVTLVLNTEKLEKTASITIGIQFPKNLLSYQSVKMGDLFKGSDFKLSPASSAEGLLLFSANSASKKEMAGTGALFEITFKAIKAGEAKVIIDKVDLKNTKGKEVLYTNKSGVTFSISAKDSTPPALKIQPVPQSVYESPLTINGETEPEAVVVVNKKDVPVKADGTFSVQVDLIKGKNSILITATDKGGNKSESTITVTLEERIIIKLKVGSKIIIVKGDPSQLDSEPFIDKQSGRTMVPLRAIAEAVGAVLVYEPKEQKIDISKGTISIQLWIGRPKAIVNGKEVSIDTQKPVSPMIVKGRTFLPLRFIGETFEFKVDWDGATQGITLTYPNPDKK